MPLDCKGYIAWGAIVTPLAVLILILICCRNQHIKNQKILKIKAQKKELTGKEREIEKLEKELASKNRGKFVK